MNRHALLAVLVLATVLPAQTKLLRFPDIHGDQVVFCYAGDLWTAGSAGGIAIRLTAHPGLELFPRFSPDGKWIAFTGQYDGDEQVYVMPATGGEPKQLTFYPGARPAAAALGLRQSGLRLVEGRQVRAVPLDARRLGPDRYAALHRAARRRLAEAAADDRRRRRRSVARREASGVLAADARLPDVEAIRRRLGAGSLYLRPRHRGARARRPPQAHRARSDVDRFDQIWFVSDRDGTLNLYSFDLASEAVEQATH